MKLVSVIIPAYNVEAYLQKSVESILRQTYTDLEIILINDGSTDGTEKICMNLLLKDPRIQYHSKKNGGPSSARNLGLEYCKGEYVMFVDADDSVDEEYVYSLVDLATQYPQDLICCKVKENVAIEKSNCRHVRHLNYREGFCSIVSDDGVSGYLWNKIFHRNVIINEKMRFDESIYIMEDLLFCLEYMHHCTGIILYEKELYHYSYLPTSIVHDERFVKAKQLSQVIARKRSLELIPKENREAFQMSEKSYYRLSLLYWIRMYKYGIYEKPDSSMINDIKSLQNKYHFPEKKFIVYRFGLIYCPRILYVFARCAMVIRIFFRNHLATNKYRNLERKR